MVIVIKQLKKLIHIKSLWLSLYLLKAILSLLLIIPFYLGVNSFAASSSFVRKLITEWDFSAVVELFSGRTEIIPIFLITLLSGAIAYIIIMQFINGGLYYIIVSGNLKPVNWREFFAECGANWGMQVKITLLMFLIYI
ncbi:MAG: hypothetical protein NTV06_07845, partial [candidate division Zixibacteria bacterium]|nr:hypothetical protein [candidate division Zixibacteria bacterium]